MRCDRCQQNEATVLTQGMCLCEPCASVTAVGALSDVTLPGVVFPPYGIAQAFGVPSPFDLGARFGQHVTDQAHGVRDDMRSLEKTVEVVAVSAAVATVGIILYKVFSKPKRAAA